MFKAWTSCRECGTPIGLEREPRICGGFVHLACEAEHVARCATCATEDPHRTRCAYDDEVAVFAAKGVPLCQAHRDLWERGQRWKGGLNA